MSINSHISRMEHGFIDNVLFGMDQISITFLAAGMSATILATFGDKTLPTYIRPYSSIKLEDMDVMEESLKGKIIKKYYRPIENWHTNTYVLQVQFIEEVVRLIVKEGLQPCVNYQLFIDALIAFEAWKEECLRLERETQGDHWGSAMAYTKWKPTQYNAELLAKM